LPIEIFPLLEAEKIQFINVVEKKKVEMPVVKMALCSGRDWLTDPIEWPSTIFGIIRVTGDEEFLKGIRHTKGVIRDAIEPQRVINYTTSQTIGAYALSPRSPYLVATKVIGKFRDQWKNMFTGNKPFIEYEYKQGWPTPKREPQPQIDQAGLMLAARATQDLKDTTSIYDATLGAPTRDESGKLNAQRQDQAATGYSVFFG